MLPGYKYTRVTAMKRMITWTAAALVAAAIILPLRVDGLSAEHAILLDANTGRVLLERDADARSLIASTTKIMTALVICEQCNVLDRMAIPKEAVGIEGSSMYLQEGEVLTIQDLLYGLMLRSGNDAATALAIYCGGTVEGFAQLMNDKAHKLGLSGTHFENPHGLDGEAHYTTAKDLAIIGAAAIRNETVRTLGSTYKTVIGEGESARLIVNHNKLLRSYVHDVGGGLFTVCGNKPGTDPSAGGNSANAYVRDDMYGSIYQEMLPVEVIEYTPPLAVMILIIMLSLF